MRGFKLIAIQVLNNCFAEARKILPLGELYKLCAHYNFVLDNSKDVISINLTQDEDINLHNLKRDNQDDLLINISAIVGKNGSGKSSILELFYAFCLCISKDQEDIKAELDKLKENASFKRNYIQILFDHLHVEVFYEVGGIIKSVKYDGNNGIKTYKFSPQRSNDELLNLGEFCYTIAINYSIYGLNEINTPWLSPMFHKNDGYQAPLVINPYREEGNIDVKKEYHLANARLIQNISLYNQPNPEIINGQKLHKIRFSFEPKTLDTIYFSGVKYDLNETINYYESSTGESIFELFNQLTNKLVNDTISPGRVSIFNQLKRNGVLANIENYRNNLASPENSSLYIEFWFTRYIIKKTFKICLQYTWFRERYIDFKKHNDLNIVAIKQGSETELIRNLLGDKSHITLKLRQTILMWQQKYFFHNVTWGTIINKNYPEFFACSCELNSSELIKVTSGFNKEKSTKEKFDLERVPGGILKPEILVIKESTNTIDEKIEKLSSGEQQLLFTIQTIVYHLKNIDSVFETDNPNKERIVAYRNVLIILDEVELYFHPEFQRKFIFELLNQIAQINIGNIKSINILFSTHSPFLLSDIKAANILKIRGGIAQKYDQTEQTFGANIHDLLANDFFMENGFMGEWAKYIIQDLVLFLNRIQESDEKHKFQWSETSAREIISIIGEPILKMRLEKLFDKKFVEHDKRLIRKRIEELQAKLLK